MPLFSIVMIAKNEAKTLPRLFASLSDFQKRGGDVCLLDTGSTDTTVEIAKSYGWKVEGVGNQHYAKLDNAIVDIINNRYVAEGDSPILNYNDGYFDFAKARNMASNIAKNDVISCIDCDEVYAALDIDEINRHIKNGADSFQYQFVFAHSDDGKELIKFTHSKFFNRTKSRWSGIIHETVTDILPVKRINVDETVLKIDHYQNKETDRSGYLRGLAIDHFFSPNNDRNTHYFARELMYCGKYKSAIQMFDTHIEMNKWPAEKAQSWIFKGDCFGYLGQPDAQIHAYYIALSIDPTRREPYLRICQYYKERNQYNQVAAFAGAALQIPYTGYYASSARDYCAVPHHYLYWSLGWLGDIEGARFHISKALEFEPNNEEFIHDTKYYG